MLSALYLYIENASFKFCFVLFIPYSLFTPFKKLLYSKFELNSIKRFFKFGFNHLYNKFSQFINGILALIC